MGVEASMTIGTKTSAVAAVVASGAAVFPAAGKVGIVSILPAADTGRIGEVQRAINHCIDYARDNNLFRSATSIAVVTTLNGGKVAVRTETLSTNVVTNDVGIMILGAVRDGGDTNIVENAHQQLLDFMNENDRLVA